MRKIRRKKTNDPVATSVHPLPPLHRWHANHYWKIDFEIGSVIQARAILITLALLPF